MFTWSEEIIVNEPKLLPDPLPGKPGYLWIDGSEYVEYERKDNTTGIITQFQRGAEGTTIQDWPANVEVYDGSEESKFNNLDPWRNIWLDQGYRYDQLYNWDDNNYEDNDDPSNIFIITSEADANVYAENNADVIISEVTGGNVNTGWQPGWDYGNIYTQTCNVTSVSYLGLGKASFVLDCAIPSSANFCKITTDFQQGDIQFVIDETPTANILILEDPSNTGIEISIIDQNVVGNGNVISNVELIPAGNDRYDALATVRSNTWVTGTATGNISITENYVPVLEPNTSITRTADITGQNVHVVAETINSLDLPTVTARVDQVYEAVTQTGPTVLRSYLRITGRYFSINEIDTPTLHIEPDLYYAQWFEADQSSTSTIIVEDDIWISENVVEGMSNTLVTFNISLDNIPWDYANATGFPALSLADLANTNAH